MKISEVKQVVGLKERYRLGLVGAGNMAKAIAKSIVEMGVLSADDIIMADPFAEGSVGGIRMIHSSADISRRCDYIIIAVKPQIYASIKNELASMECDCVISIMAGINSADLTDTFIGATDVVRVMPNAPSMVGSGMTAIADNQQSRKHSEFLGNVFGAIGEYMYIDERHFDTVTAISGSGPAYFYMFINAMIEAGIGYGMDEGTAKKLACYTAKGAADMLLETVTPTPQLIDAVCSKGGTTIQAVEYYRANGLENIVKHGVDKARQRSIELGK